MPFDLDGLAQRVRRVQAIVMVGLAMFLSIPHGGAQAAEQLLGENLEQDFKAPPDSAKPRVWWHWLNGNVTERGITADLEWMKRVGIGGMQFFDVDPGTPVFVAKRLAWMTPEWKRALRHAAEEANRLDLEMTMHVAGGWSETGGPWVTPSEAMKKYVWSEVQVRGPGKFAGALPLPPTVSGPFQATTDPDHDGAARPDFTFYADAAVVAYRVPAEESSLADRTPIVTSSAGAVELGSITGDEPHRPFHLGYSGDGKRPWVQFQVDRPFEARSVTIALVRQQIPEGEIQVSQNGREWRSVAFLRSRNYVPTVSELTYSFQGASGTFYRVIFQPPSEGEAPQGSQARAMDILKIEFHGDLRVNHWQEKAAFGITNYTDPIDLDTVPTPPGQPAAIDRREVIDLSGKLGRDGTLNWKVPKGVWRVVRLGYSLTGSTNSPATPEATGLEVDKLSRVHVEKYFNSYTDLVSSAIGPYFGKSLRYFLMDSWEAGNENWTDNLLAEFRRRRGYDLLPYLPVLTGRVVGSADVSERVLWDFRRVLADLLTENHYGAAAEQLHKLGIGLYAEAMGPGLPTTGDGIANKGRVDIPMGEFHLRNGGRIRRDDAPDVREAASAAHVYGKRIVATESFTSNMPGWGLSPFELKPFVDRFLAMGVNRVAFSSAVHQPFLDEEHKPGLTLGGVGTHYGRNVTWAEQSLAWNMYLARSSYLLQQGLYVADLAYYYGEGAPIAVPFWKELRPAPPDGYSYDWVNTEVLLKRVSVIKGRLVLPDGMSYRALVLPEDVNQLTLPVARKIRDLVAAGATVIAPRPLKSPSLTGYPESDEEIRDIDNEVWGPIDGRTITEHDYENGRVFWGKRIEEVLGKQSTPPDFTYNRPQFDTSLAWIHRKLDEADIYFVANQRKRPEDIRASFRVEGKDPELWHPDTGEIETADYRFEDGRTIVPLHLDPFGSVFVMFRRKASSVNRSVHHPISRELARVEGPWDVTFPPNWGAPARAHLKDLISWTDSSDDGVKYFSGTATYSTEIDIQQGWISGGEQIVLDLGKVKEFAEVLVNGIRLNAILWKPPYQVDIARLVQPGANHLDIRITNLWPNRMIGDQQPGVAKKYTFTDYPAYKRDSPLLESGLIGPVTLLARSITRIRGSGEPCAAAPQIADRCEGRPDADRPSEK